ncbi:unnamed protein product [Mytilus coruscus]|uniref:Reverse transcriptase domain-containing protein n=1 Tax=Mytilus coruscus TaxID=42192 RepID=A0A6J8DVW8_MYTCO|nr:unnamed protein product [Mytilus coruscus]
MFMINDVGMCSLTRDIKGMTHNKPNRNRKGEIISREIIKMVKEDILITRKRIWSGEQSSEDIGLTDLVEHIINTDNHPPVRQGPRRIPRARIKDADAEIQKTVKQDIIEPSTSPCNSNIVLVKKSDDSWRFCIDFRANPEGQLARWFEVLASYDFKIEHRAGRSHNNACILAFIKNVLNVLVQKVSESSRNVQDVSTQTKGLNNSQNEKDNPVKEIYFENVSESQLSEDVISKIIQWKIDEVKPNWADVSHMSPDVEFYWSRLNSLILVNGILYRKWESYNGKHYDLHFVLQANFKKVRVEVHNTVTGGHLGEQPLIF